MWLAFKLLSLHSNYSRKTGEKVAEVVVISFQITIFTQQLQRLGSVPYLKHVVISFQITIFTQQLQQAEPYVPTLQELWLAFKLLSLHSNYSYWYIRGFILVVVISFQITIFTQQLQLQWIHVCSKSVVISFQITIFTQQLQLVRDQLPKDRSCD